MIYFRDQENRLNSTLLFVAPTFYSKKEDNFCISNFMPELNTLCIALVHLRRFEFYQGSTNLWTKSKQLILATGHWGCGKYGGNCQLKCKTFYI
jgi:hypothetical protein